MAVDAEEQRKLNDELVGPLTTMADYTAPVTHAVSENFKKIPVPSWYRGEDNAVASNMLLIDKLQKERSQRGSRR